MNLFLEDGSVFKGETLGAEIETVGEVVFNTSMTGYQEMLTDPSYRGQILILTYPLAGNYGMSNANNESSRIQVRALVVREDYRCAEVNDGFESLHNFLVRAGVPGVKGIDTRALTRRIRNRGVMMGIVTPREDVQAAMNILKATPPYNTTHFVSQTGTTSPYTYEPLEEEKKPFMHTRLHDLRLRSASIGDKRRIKAEQTSKPKPFRASSIDKQENEELRADLPSRSSSVGKRNERYPLRIVIIDYGVKLNILRSFKARGCRVIIVPPDTGYDEIMSNDPDGVVLSPGPGDPSLPELIEENGRTVRRIAENGMPIMAICLGHQVMAHAFGGSTYKLHFGHRGGNQPVKDLRTGRVYITSHNHGYAVDLRTIPKEMEVTHINLNDNTVEGMRHKKLPVITIQYHPESSPGPYDSEYMFDRFIALIMEQSH